MAHTMANGIKISFNLAFDLNIVYQNNSGENPCDVFEFLLPFL